MLWLSPNRIAPPKHTNARSVTAPVEEVAKVEEFPATTLTPGDTRRLSFENVYNTNEWSSTESHSGKGSTLKYTARVRKLIDYAVEKYGLHSMVDAPSGDCNWQPTLNSFAHLNYTGIDIVAKIVLDNAKKYKNLKNARYMNLDLVQDELSNTDFFLVRDVIQHLPLEDGVQILKNVEATSAKYLITNFHVNKEKRAAVPNWNIEPGRFFPNNVMLAPYNLPEPLSYILDMDDDYFAREGPEMHIKLVGIWKLPVLGRGDGKAFSVDFDEAKEIVHLHDGR